MTVQESAAQVGGKRKGESHQNERKEMLHYGVVNWLGVNQPPCMSISRSDVIPRHPILHHLT